MGEKKNDAGEKKKNGDGGEKKKDDNPITVVLKIDMHCEGCASKIVKTVRGFDGVDAAKTEFGANKLSVIGKLDPAKLREKLAEKMKKKVDLISPQPNKKDGEAKNDDNKKNKPDGNDNKKNPDEKKPKEKQIPVSTAVFKLRLHCEGCISKIRKTVTKTKGFSDMSMDKQKETVTVVGSMDMKALAEALQERLKRPVEIVPPKKEKGEKDEGKDENAGGGKKKGGDGNNNNKIEENRMEYVGLPVPGFGFGYGPGPGHGFEPGFGFGYGFGYGPVPVQGYMGHQVQPHAPQMFSDENPNACSVM